MKIARIVFVAAAFAGVPGTLHSQAVPDRPFIMSSTFWGGSGVEDFATVATDAAGNVYVAGSTTSSDFPRTVSNLPAGAGSMDIFVSKFDPAGNLLLSTVFGGSSSERVTAMAVDATGHIIIVGDTSSPDLPMVNAIQSSFHQGFCGEFGAICPDGFVVKLDPTAQSVVFSSYLGSTRLDNVVDVALSFVRWKGIDVAARSKTREWPVESESESAVWQLVAQGVTPCSVV